MKHYLLAVALLGACANESTTRETASYIIEAILVPHCAHGGCHTSVTKPHNLAFDTIPAAIASMKSVDKRSPLVTPGDSARSELYTILQYGASGIMPPDAPLAQADIDLIQHWIDDGAEGLE